MGAVMIEMGAFLQNCAVYFLPMRSMGRGTNRRLVEGASAQRSLRSRPLRHAFAKASARHLPKASLQGGCV